MEVLKDTKLCMSVHCLLFFHVHLLKCSAVHSAVFSNDGHAHTPGMGIVKNANFCSNETDFPWRIFVVCVGKKLAVQKREEKMNTGFSFAPHTCETYGVRLFAAVACLGHVLVNTVICYYSRGLATGLNLSLIHI